MDYPNRHRTKEQRKARYCFLRHIGFCRLLSRSIVGKTDSRIIREIIYNSEFIEGEYIDNRKNKKKT